MPFTFRQLACLTCIVSFPLFILLSVTQGFIDTLPLFENPDTGITLMYTGFIYLVASLFLRVFPRYIFFGFYITALCCLLAGAITYYYFWHFVPYPLELGGEYYSQPPGWGAGF
ncbi:hypothetical protein MRBLMN1_006085 [Chitinophaga ginsengisegetis]|uniref:hypothetical protein n=1 Tax=Chitinophaga ginsengisegetis TaxID=393003 RepID=UPI000DBA7780|nr:hypothetical protein [Chitinophaga ginsengisegetis]MDR6650969.1 hypothetical protein [Chitinophaga ginsengisegetis]MDR6657277.1 hypothetical protein [Chitinophaga ginsengisegetis]